MYKSILKVPFVRRFIVKRDFLLLGATTGLINRNEFKQAYKYAIEGIKQIHKESDAHDVWVWCQLIQAINYCFHKSSDLAGEYIESTIDAVEDRYTIIQSLNIENDCSDKLNELRKFKTAL